MFAYDVKSVKDLVPLRVCVPAAIAWEESRRKWVGDTSQKTQSIAKDPIIR